MCLSKASKNALADELKKATEDLFDLADEREKVRLRNKKKVGRNKNEIDSLI